MAPKEPERFGVIMRRTRLAQDVSLDELSEATGISKAVLDLYERNVTRVHGNDRSERIVEALGNPHELRSAWKWHLDKFRFERGYGPGASN